MTPPETPPDELGLGRRVFNRRTLLSFAVAIALLAFLFSRVQLDVGQVVATILRADPLLVLLALAVYYLVFPVRGLRWQLMLRNAGVPSPLGALRLGLIIFMSWFANCVVPAKLGDVYRAYLLRKHSGLSLSMAGGTIVAERLVDFAFVLILLGASALAIFRGRLPPEVLPFLEIGALLVLVAGLGLLALRRWDTFLLRFLPTRLHGIYERFHGGTIGAFGSYGLLLLYTPLGWLPEFLRFWLVARAVGLDLGEGLVQELGVAVFVSLGSALFTTATPTPGGLGGAELAIVAALGLLGATGEVAVAAALLDRVISYWSLVLFGFLTYLAIEARQRGLPAAGSAYARRD